ncbi:hypothetical protein JTE90_012774 [Oedothorax gibbosus]|uniref:Uncharacterized protein n=1 Tax=Oedothorax gibbosus TaxID=931172 RepID=A0AAV6W193_9ARAC|nr:hypothetical protein JTE90_012774 [Oedothorax gibbosus]
MILRRSHLPCLIGESSPYQIRTAAGRGLLGDFCIGMSGMTPPEYGIISPHGEYSAIGVVRVIFKRTLASHTVS